MTWLLAHMWLALLFAAFFGGLIGWALRHLWKWQGLETKAGFVVDSGSPEATARIVELETQLAAERDELTHLRAELRTSSAVHHPEEEPEEGTVEWRNRYLESRVRFLEKQLTEAEERAGAGYSAVDDSEDESERLVWRNRYLEGRVRYLEDELAKGGSLTIAAPKSEDPPPEPVGDKPATLEAPRGGRADNLKQIGGVGPKIERLLNDLGIFHFEQIATWTDREVAWVNSEISFKGRIERENWVSQAQALAKGLEPESKRT